ncbi:MAG: thioredoxin family protein [Planctomycetes bacterium]|nr:thioredoxin family protein [Planctomycetota bacterium]
MKLSRMIGAGAAVAALAALTLVTSPVGAEEAPAARARIGEQAPAFSLTDLQGRTHTLEQYRGKVVVLEWFNPDCPFVVKHHQHNKTMKDLAAKYKDRDVVWLAINSGAAGKQGAGQERNERAVREFGIEYPVLLDPTGATGRAYAAVTTPHMYVIDTQGVLRYQGAIDDDRDAKRVGRTNHVAQALDAVLGGQAVPTAETRPYGCSVKYAANP